MVNGQIWADFSSNIGPRLRERKGEREREREKGEIERERDRDGEGKHLAEVARAREKESTQLMSGAKGRGGHVGQYDHDWRKSV